MSFEGKKLLWSEFSVCFIALVVRPTVGVLKFKTKNFKLMLLVSTISIFASELLSCSMLFIRWTWYAICNTSVDCDIMRFRCNTYVIFRFQITVCLLNFITSSLIMEIYIDAFIWVEIYIFFWFNHALISRFLFFSMTFPSLLLCFSEIMLEIFLKIQLLILLILWHTCVAVAGRYPFVTYSFLPLI